MEHLPSSNDQLFLIESLTELARKKGAAPLARAELVLPSRACFPDPYEPTLRGAERILRRLLGYAGLDHVELEIEGYENEVRVDALGADGRPCAHRREGAAAWFAALARRRCVFGVAEQSLGDEEQLVATLAHEVAHAWRHAHRLVAPSSYLEERLTDLTTVYLGFGIFTVNGTYRYRSGSDGTLGGYSVSHARAGYLSPQDMSFLLAIVARCRALGFWERRRIGGLLEPNQRAFFKAAFKQLGRAHLEDELTPLYDLLRAS